MRWSLCVLALAGLGWVLHVWLPPLPRCTIRGPNLLRAVTPDGRKLISTQLVAGPRFVAQEAGPLRVWDTHSGREIGAYLPEMSDITHAFAFSADRRFFATIIPTADPAKGNLALVDLVAGREWPALRVVQADGTGRNLHFRQPTFSPQGNFVVFDEGPFPKASFHIVETKSGQLLTTLSGNENTAHAPFRGFTSDDERFVFLEAAPPGLAVWNSKTRQSGRTHKELRHPDDALFSPTGTVLAIFLGQFEGADPAVVLWDVKTEKSRPLTPPRKQFHDAWFSPDGRTLATREARELELWDVASGRRRGILAAKGDPLFSPDSRLILVDCGADRAISAWDCQSGELAWQSDPADRLVFTPDSRFLMSGRDRVGRIDIVEPMVGLRRTRITLARGVDFASRYPPPHYAATFSRDGKLVAIRNNMPGTRQSGALQRWLGNWWSSQSGIYVTVVAELGSGREVFRLETTDLLHSILADDGKTLVTSHYRDGDKESVIHCWDIPAPWRWEVAAIPAGVGLLVLFGIWWRGRRKTH